MSHAYTTLAFQIPQNARPAVEAALVPLSNPAEDPFRSDLDQAAIVHFMCMAIVDGDPGNLDHLVIEMSSDGTEAEALALFEAGGALGDRVAPLFRALELEPIQGRLAKHLIPVGSGWHNMPRRTS